MRLSELFQKVANNEGAGIVLQRIGKFRESAEAFENAGLWQRAAYCYERAGDNARAVEMRCRTEEPIRPQKQAASTIADGRNPFVLEDTGTQSQLGEQQNIQFDSDEATVAITDQAAQKIAIAEKVKEDPTTSRHWQVYAKSRFVEELSKAQKKAFWDIGSIVSYQKADTILAINSEASGMYFILEGEVSCQRKKAGNIIEVDTMTSPSTFGEFWLLIEAPSEVRFVAKSPVTVLQVARGDFNELLDKNGAIARILYKRFSRHLVAKLINSSKK